MSICSEEKQAKATNQKDFWKHEDVKRFMIHAALKETLECLKGEVPQTLRFAEEAKRTLAEALEAFLEVYYHRVHLLTHHRGCITPSSKDFALATLMSSEETLKRSLEETKERTASEPSMPCKRRRLRPMPPSALCGFDIEEGLGANLGGSVLEVANPSTPSAYTIPPADGSVVTEMAD